LTTRWRTTILVAGNRTSRGVEKDVSSVHGRTLIINLPGSTSVVRELVPHAIEVRSGKPEDYRK